MLLKEGKINDRTIRLITSWRYSGFNVDNRVYIGSSNRDGLEGLVQYVARAPLLQEKILLADSEDKVIYHSMLNPTLKRNFQIFDPVEWIAAVTSHIPDKGEHMIRYYGYYSNQARGKRMKEKANPEHLNIKEKGIIDRILSHRGQLEERTHSPPEEETQAVELTYEPCYDDLPINEIL